MFFKTSAECATLVESLGFRGDDLRNGLKEPIASRSIKVHNVDDLPIRQLFPIAATVASWLADMPMCVLWLTEFGVFPSSENMHLYYRLRSSYGDGRELIDAPGHVFRGYEKPELTTFLGLVIQFGWEGHLIYAPGWTRVFFSSDGWMRIWPGEKQKEILQDLDRLQLDYEVDGESTPPIPEGRELKFERRD